MPNLTKLPTWADKKLVHAVVETPRCKLEFDTKLRAFALEKFFEATDALEDKKLKFLGWRGPTHAVKSIKRLSL